MDPDKKKALEAAGWKFGSVEEFLGKAPMSDDQMLAEFEQWAKSEGFDLTKWIKVEDNGQLTPTEYACSETRTAEKAYAAGRKAEREWMQLKNWDGIRLGTTKLEGEG